MFQKCREIVDILFKRAIRDGFIYPINFPRDWKFRLVPLEMIENRGEELG